MLKKIEQERKRKDRKVTNMRGFILHAGDMKMSVMQCFPVWSAAGLVEGRCLCCLLCRICLCGAV